MVALEKLLKLMDVRTALLCVTVLLVARWFLAKPKNLPPGPWGLPIVGSLVSVARGMLRGVQPRELFMKYAAKYGPVFHLRILNKDVVVLNDYASVREAFQHPQLNDRPHSFVTDLFQNEGVIVASGEPWLELRRFCLTVLRSFGVGKSSFEEQIGTEARELMKVFSATDGKPFNPKPQLGNATANVICAVAYGKRYEYDDLVFKKFLAIVEKNIKLLGTGGAINFFPVLRFLPFVPAKELVANLKEIRHFINSIIDNHRASFDAHDVRDFTDAYLKEMELNKRRDKADAKNSHLNEYHFPGTISNLFAAGTETTATTLQWCLLYMVVYPDVQKRVQDEIDAVVGRNRLPRMADKLELNFTRAVIWEVQRLSMILPLGIAHSAASDTEICGYRIPEGALLVSNLWAVGRDPATWPNPDDFRPERFLNDKGKAVKAEELIPFAVGRRACAGEHLAKMELYLFFTYFLHQYTFKKPDNSPPLSLKGVSGFTITPSPFELCAMKRD